jgi:molybdopterin/thiamine biosynthesis adenylyltransferase
VLINTDTDVPLVPPAVRTDEAPWTLRITARQRRTLDTHLFPGDGDEHAAVIVCGVVETERGTRLLAREVLLARDGIDFVPGKRGYKMLTAEFVNAKIRRCRDRRLAYLAVHNHGRGLSVAFSSDDLRSHARGYPALLDIGAGVPVGALVCSGDAIAGDIWTPDRRRRALAETVVVGARTVRLYDRPAAPPPVAPQLYARQALLFGAAGQALLRRQKVAIIGAGGVGMLLVSLLARLGVGHLVVIDPERVELTNLPRLPEATRRDAMALLTRERNPAGLRRVGQRLARPKVKVAARIARRASRTVQIEAIKGDIVDAAVARRIVDADAVMLAADTQQARVVFNALVHQHLIPGWQIGSKVQVNKQTGAVLDVFSIVRRVVPEAGCLWCNGAINPARLAEEALDPATRAAQRYVDDALVAAPSVITLNAIGAARAADQYMLATTGLLREVQITYCHEAVQTGRVRHDAPRRDADCRDCGEPAHSRLALGDGRDLPWRGQ